MSAKQFLFEKFDMQPATESELAAVKAEYVAHRRQQLAHDMFFYVMGSCALALMGLAYEQAALNILGGIILGVAALAYVSVNSQNVKQFEKAIEPVGLTGLPHRLILLQENNASLKAELEKLLKQQNSKVFRYQIHALYSVNHRDRIRDLQAAL